MIASLGHAEYPDRAIRLLVPYAPGGTTDMISRMVGQKLSERIGQPVVVDNKPGGAEQIAMNTLKSAPADGYTILISNVGGLSINPSLYGSKLSYDPHRDLVPVSLIASLPSIFFVHPSLPVTTLDELTEYLRKNPDAVSYASSGPGQGSHLAMELYKSLAKVEANHIPYKGGAPALQDLAAGHVKLMVAIGAEGMPFANVGKMRALAVTTPTTSPLFPNLPPAAQSRGLAGFELQTWYGYVAKAGTSPVIVDKLYRSITEVLNDTEIQKKMKDMGVEVLAGTPKALSARMDADTVRWKAVIDSARIKVD
jgi:tripartite-type tricarboxylate transporter receptor subunit TctC